MPRLDPFVRRFLSAQTNFNQQRLKIEQDRETTTSTIEEGRKEVLNFQTAV
jgi:hypothetical protein